MLARTASRAVAWSAGNQIVTQGLAFGVSVVLARLLAPEVFGAVAMLMVLTSLADVFVDGGFSPALIQRDQISERDKSTAFWFNACAGILLTLLMFASSGLIAAFYNTPILESVAKVYCLQIVLGALCSTQNALFARELDFKTPLRISGAASLAGAGLGIGLALYGFGVWALAFQAVVTALVRLLSTWSLSSWRPSVCFDFDSFRKLFGFGSYLFLARLLNAGYLNLYSILIGRWHGAHDLGIYSRANATQALPTQSLAGIVNSVAFPIFARAQENAERLRRGLRTAIVAIMFLNIPMMLGLAMVSESFIATVYGPRWLSAAPLLSILAVAGILWPLHLLNLSVLQALGQGKRFMRLEILKKVAAIPFIVVGSYWGVAGLAWATLAASVVGVGLNAWYTRRLIGLGLATQLKACLPSLWCGASMAIVVWIVQSSIVFPPAAQLLISSAVGAGVYFALARGFRLEALVLVRNWITALRPGHVAA
jgi:teichuronic acid exporter